MTVTIGRRELLAALGGVAAAWPLGAGAQQQPMPVIGILAGASPEDNAVRLRAFREGLRVAGYVEGQNVNIQYRWAEAHTDRLAELAAQLVHDQVSVLVAAGGTPSALTAKAATASIPIVFGTGADPVDVGLVASLNRPGGNVTGVTSLSLEVAPKRLELLHELLPSVTTMALLVNPAVPALAGPAKDLARCRLIATIAFLRTRDPPVVDGVLLACYSGRGLGSRAQARRDQASSRRVSQTDHDDRHALVEAQAGEDAASAASVEPSAL
jgi:ABC transporter substrate binding protein